MCSLFQRDLSKLASCFPKLLSSYLLHRDELKVAQLEKKKVKKKKKKKKKLRYLSLDCQPDTKRADGRKNYLLCTIQMSRMGSLISDPNRSLYIKITTTSCCRWLGFLALIQHPWHLHRDAIQFVVRRQTVTRTSRLVRRDKKWC